MDFYDSPCFEVESYYIDSKSNESDHYYGSMRIDLDNKAHFIMSPFQETTSEDIEINGELHDAVGICTKSIPPHCVLNISAIEKGYFSFDDGNGNSMELHFDKNDGDYSVFSGKDEDGLVYLKLKEGECFLTK